MIFHLLAAGIIGGNIFIAPSCLGSTAISAHPGIVFITIDTLRADHLGCYGYVGIKTPVIDSLAKQGVLFQEAYTPVPITFPSHVSLLTGMYPPLHQIRNNGNFTLDDEVVTLAETLAEHGYKTAAIVGAYVLASYFGLDQGFEYYDDDFSEGGLNSDHLFQEKRAEQVTDSAIKWLGKNYQSPFFLWLHYFDPHASYSAPSPFHEEYSQSPYDGEIAYTDFCLGKLFKKLQEWGIFDKTVIILTSDHGESLGEHGELTHGVFIYDTTLRVPLIIKGNILSLQKKIISRPVRTIDIVPSILEISGIKPNTMIQGKSLVDLLHHKPEAEERMLYCESYLPYYNHGWSPLVGLRSGQWKYIKAPKPELYNVEKDPQERQNQIKTQEAVKAHMERKLQDLLASQAHPKSGPSHEILPSQIHMEKLMSLGYVVTSPLKKMNGPLADPKDKIELLDYLDRGMGYLLAGDPNGAISEFQSLIARDPENIFAHLILGSTYSQKELYDAALKEFRKVVQLDDSYMDVHSRLAFIYDTQGVAEQAAKEYQLAIQGYPKCAENYNLLANIYLKTGRYDEAVNQLETAVELKPDFSLAHNNLGLAYGKLKRYASALEEFQKALDGGAAKAEIHNNLGCVYLELGILLKQKEVRPRFPIPSREMERIYKLIPEIKDRPAIAFELAQNAFEEVLKIDSLHREARINLGLSYLNNGLVEKAMAEYERLLQQDPADTQSRLHLAVIYLQSGLTEKGEDSLEEILRSDPNHIQARYYLGSLYLRMNKVEEAIAQYRRLIIMQPQNPECHFYLGEAYRAHGETESAISELRKALAIDPNHSRARQSLSSLLNPMKNSSGSTSE